MINRTAIRKNVIILDYIRLERDYKQILQERQQKQEHKIEKLGGK